MPGVRIITTVFVILMLCIMPGCLSVKQTGQAPTTNAESTDLLRARQSGAVTEREYKMLRKYLARQKASSENK